VSPVKYELSFYIPEDDILHSQRRKNLKSYYESVMGKSVGGNISGKREVSNILP
jgi:hypothetical protein